MTIAMIVEEVSPSTVSAVATGAASVYVASHILLQPRSLTDISVLTTVSESAILQVYKLILDCRYGLVCEEYRNIVGGNTLGEAAEALPNQAWPPVQHDVMFSGGETEHVDVSPESGSDLHTSFEIAASWLSVGRPGFNRGTRTWALAQDINREMKRTLFELKTLNPWTIAAATLYMASHLASEPKSIDEISALAGIPSAWIRDRYRIMYSAREQIVRRESFQGEQAFTARAAALSSLPDPSSISDGRNRAGGGY